MKKILFISQYLNRNGTEAFMMNVFRGLNQHLFQVDFLLYSPDATDYSREVEAAGGHVYRVPSRKQSLFLWHFALNDFFKKHAAEYHAIHFCGNSLTSIAPIYYAYRYGIPVRIVHAHNSSARGLHNRLLHKLKRNYAYGISTHHFACSTLAAEWFFAGKPSVIIRNGIDLRRFSYDFDVRRLYRGKLNLAEDELVVGHVGRFVPEKNHGFIMDIFARLAERRRNVRLMLIGVGQNMIDVQQKAEMLGLQEKVLFLGERSDVPALMQAMDVFLMPSLFEGLPFVLVEAQAAGLPCLISDTINRDIAITPDVHFKSLSESPSLWAGKLDEVTRLHTRRKTDAALEASGYSINNTIDYLQQVYQSNTV